MQYSIVYTDKYKDNIYVKMWKDESELQLLTNYNNPKTRR